MVGINGCRRVWFFVRVVGISVVGVKVKVEVWVVDVCLVEGEEVGMELVKVVVEVVREGRGEGI